MKLVMSPANRAYLDMQYNPDSPLGLHWAGYVEVQDAYSWDPATLVDGVGEKDILGVEGALWSETIDSSPTSSSSRSRASPVSPRSAGRRRPVARGTSTASVWRRRRRAGT